MIKSLKPDNSFISHYVQVSPAIYFIYLFQMHK